MTPATETAMSMLTSLRTSGGKIEIIDQLLLPHTTKYVEITSIEEAHDAIRDMKIRGAPAIASLASLAFAAYIQTSLDAAPPPAFLISPESLAEHVTSKLNYLFGARPTAVNLGTAIRRIKAVLQSSIDAGKPVQSAAAELIREAQLIADEDFDRNKRMSEHGGEWLGQVDRLSGGSGEGLNILTVCNTGSLATSGYGTALGLITYLHEQKKLGKAYYTQTAPYHQGSRLTALELKTMQIPSVMICDTMVGSLFQHHKIHAVAVGADRIARNGDTANKIGTYNAAVLAARHKIPFIVVAPISTLDLDTPNGSHIPIEHRKPLEACLVRGAVHPFEYDAEGRVRQETVMITPSDLDGIYNPSFDVTPAELITAIVTEKGVATRKEGETSFDLSGIV